MALPTLLIVAVVLFHLLLIFGILISPILFSWKIILVGVIIYHIQLAVFGGCILTLVQFGKNTDASFWAFILGKMGMVVSKEKITFFTDYVLPGILLAIAIILQEGFNKRPLWLGS